MLETSCAIFIKSFVESGIFSLAYYSHLIPVFITVVLAVFLLYKTKFSLLSKILAYFSLFFCIWLVGDLILWTQPDYNLISFVWAPLDYINILFYLFGAYFFSVLIKEKDISVGNKIFFLTLSLPAWWITFSGNSISALNLPYCEAFNNESLTTYKLAVESFVVIYILYLAITHWKKAIASKRKQIIAVGSALILFFAVFSATEYISSQTGIYEINLYSLFVLPLFLGIIIYAIVSMNIFQMKYIGTQVMVYVLLIMIGSQYFLLENTTNKALTAITFLISSFFSYILIQTSKRELEARKHIEELVYQLEEANVKLQDLDKMKTEFLSLASHQLRSPLTAIKGYASMLLEGSYGPVKEDQKVPVDRIFQSSVNLAQIVEDLLDVSKIEQGGMKFEMSDVDLVSLLKGLSNELQVSAKSRNLELSLTSNLSDAIVVADPVKIRQVFANYVDNALKYTEKGTVKITITKSEDGKKIVVGVKDSGMGIPPEIMKTLFKKFERGEGGKVNAGGSGLGLYLAKEIVTAHKGRTWAESEGHGKGSTFFVELSLK